MILRDEYREGRCSTGMEHMGHDNQRPVDITYDASQAPFELRVLEVALDVVTDPTCPPFPLPQTQTPILLQSQGCVA